MSATSRSRPTATRAGTSRATARHAELHSIAIRWPHEARRSDPVSPLEGSARIELVADGLADELALRGWLLSNPLNVCLIGYLARRALEEIDGLDETTERAA